MITIVLSSCFLAYTFICCSRSLNFSLESAENDNKQKVTDIFNASVEISDNVKRGINSPLENKQNQMIVNLNEQPHKGENGGPKSNIEEDYNTRENNDQKNEPTQSTIKDQPSVQIDHPYVVLVVNMKFFNSLGCSGSILTNLWVLTSAQCLRGIHGVQFVYVYAGGMSMEEVKAHLAYKQQLPQHSQLEHARELILHPEYNFDEERPDIGLIRVENEFKITSAVSTIRFSITPWKGSNGDGSRTCLFSKVGNHRKTFITSVKHPCPCHGEFVNFFGRLYADLLLCSDPLGDTDFCDGTAGAGLVCDGEIHAVAPISVPFKNVYKCETSKRPVPSMSVCDVYNSLIAYEDTCPFVKWINNYTHVYSDDEIVECAASSHCLHFVVDFLIIVLILWIW